MDKQLLKQALTKFFAGVILMGLLLFLPAGSIAYPGGWLFLGLLFLPMLFLGVFLLWKAPALLEKRLSHREQQTEQKQVVGVSALMFLLGFLLSALDYRLGWSHVPPVVTGIAAALLLFSYGLYAEVMRENAWLSRTVELQENQKVIDTGLYGIVRHPMYSATIVLFLSIPLVLGSWIGFVIFLPYPLLLVRRIRSEEELLEKGLPGYREYKSRVRWRLFPFLW